MAKKLNQAQTQSSQPTADCQLLHLRPALSTQHSALRFSTADCPLPTADFFIFAQHFFISSLSTILSRDGKVFQRIPDCQLIFKK